MTASKRCFSSLPFYVVMTVVSVVVFADSIHQFLETQSHVPGAVRVVLWTIIAFHFARLTLKGLKQADPV